MRQDFPAIAAAVDACRARRCAVTVVHASEGGNERGDAGAFLRAHSEACAPWSVELHRLFTQAQAAEARHLGGRGPRGTLDKLKKTAKIPARR